MRADARGAARGLQAAGAAELPTTGSTSSSSRSVAALSSSRSRVFMPARAGLHMLRAQLTDSTVVSKHCARDRGADILARSSADTVAQFFITDTRVTADRPRCAVASSDFAEYR